MRYEHIMPETIKADIVEAMGTDINTSEGSFIDSMIGPVAYQIWLAYGELDKMLDIMFINTSDGEFVERRCEEEGIYRRPGTKATGAVTFTGANGTVIPAGTLVQTEDGLQFATLAEGVISSGSADVEVESVDVGIRYNIEAESVTRMVINIAGVSGVTNAEAFENGTDPETVEELKARYLEQKKRMPASGNKTDYIRWATEVSGIENARVFPLWNGPGTVKVVLVGKDNTVPPSGSVAAAITNIESKRPIGAEVSVSAVTPVSINITAKVAIDPDYALNDIKADFENRVTEYFGGFDGDRVYYNRIAAILMSVDGVLNFTELKLNGETSSINIAEDEVPALGTLTVTGVA